MTVSDAGGLTQVAHQESTSNLVGVTKMLNGRTKNGVASIDGFLNARAILLLNRTTNGLTTINSSIDVRTTLIANRNSVGVNSPVGFVSSFASLSVSKTKDTIFGRNGEADAKTTDAASTLSIQIPTLGLAAGKGITTDNGILVQHSQKNIGLSQTTALGFEDPTAKQVGYAVNSGSSILLATDEGGLTAITQSITSGSAGSMIVADNANLLALAQRSPAQSKSITDDTSVSTQTRINVTNGGRFAEDSSILTQVRYTKTTAPALAKRIGIQSVFRTSVSNQSTTSSTATGVFDVTDKSNVNYFIENGSAGSLILADEGGLTSIRGSERPVAEFYAFGEEGFGDVRLKSENVIADIAQIASASKPRIVDTTTAERQLRNWLVTTESDPGGAEASELVEEVRTFDELQLTLRSDSQTVNNVLQDINPSAGKVDIINRFDGGFDAVDRLDGENTFQIFAPTNTNLVRPVETWLVDEYTDTPIGTGAERYEVELKLIPKQEKSFDSTTGTVPDTGFLRSPERDSSIEWLFEFTRGKIVTADVGVDIDRSATGTVDTVELALFVDGPSVRIIEENASKLNAARIRDRANAKAVAQDNTEDNRNTVFVDPADGIDTVDSGEFVIIEWETTWLDGLYQIDLELAAKST